MIRIELIGTPVAKARAKVGKWGGYTPKPSKAYSNALAGAALKAMNGLNPMRGALHVKIWAEMPIPKSLSLKKAIALESRPHTKKPDLDNIIKQLDALNGIVYKDDNQIAQITAWKFYGLNPKLVIEVHQI